MKKNLLLFINIVLFLFASFTLMAQKQGNYWYFGDNAGLNFSADPPTILTDGMLNTTEGCATMSDANGNLLFYTDGIYVYNRLHGTMPNGTGLTGDPSTSQSAVAVPDPGNANRYYIFTVSSYPSSNLSYSIVDMTLDEGMGDVLPAKNVSVLTNTEETVCAVFADNFYWILTHQRGTNTYYAYKLKTTGLDMSNPVTSSLGVATSSEGEIGYLKSNVAGNKLTTTYYFGGTTEVYDFDRVTGILSNAISLAITSSYGVEFSPNSKLLYVHGFGGGTYQFNLEAGSQANIQASKVTLKTGAMEGALQVAVNGKIYVANYGANSLSVINDPNVLGSGCNYVYGGQSLGSKTSEIGLPTIISSLVATGPPVLSTPDATSITGHTATISAIVNGDGGSAITERGFYFGTSAEPTTNKTVVTGTTGSFSADITGLTSGTTYYYRAYAINANGTSYSVDGSFEASGPSGPVVTTEFNINNIYQCVFENSYSFTNTSTISSGTMTFDWRFGDGEVSTDTNATHSYAVPGDYTVSLIVIPDVGAPDTITHDVHVVEMPYGELTAPNGTFICGDGTALLKVTGGSFYQWFLNDNLISGAYGDQYQAVAAGVYTVKVFNELDCSSMIENSITLTHLNAPTADFSFDKYCVGIATAFTNTSVTTGSGEVNYSWNFGNTTYGTDRDASVTYSEAGEYTVELQVTPVGCPLLVQTKTKTVVLESPVAGQRYAAVDASIGVTKTLSARDLDATVQWLPADNLSISTSFSPVLTPVKQQEYKVKFSFVSGCTTVDTVLVKVLLADEIFVPKAFTPNGDGKNDVLRPIMAGVRELQYFRVYNRWGNLLFETKDATRGWDGTFKGVRQPMETYIWVAAGVSAKGTQVHTTGNTTLIR
ncbi:MAG: PKD domain-containing protein [Flavitalea sp.]